jgi:hypothetical protein
MAAGSSPSPAAGPWRSRVASSLLVVVASAASQVSLLPQLRAIANYQKLGYVASETMFTLAERVPELVPEP